MANVPGRRRHRPLLTLFLLLVLLASGSVVIQRFVAPPPTFLMVSRALEGEGLSYRWRSLDDISPRLVQAVIASEDSTFCAHNGFDMKAIERALQANARAEKRGSGRIRGGSTISQQTAKNVFLWPGRDWIRKGLAAGYTVALETVWGQRRRMEVYR
ncbi:MAG: transglycosylase domain-containing protein, partial [bacterium]